MAPSAAEDYQVGIVCALDSELAAIEGMLDEEYDVSIMRESHDSNSYSFGRIHNHNVVVACLPAGTDGLAAAAMVAKDMMRTFTQLRFGLLVGIGGGIPHLETGIDIRLGDVVVSHPSGTNGGVVQYDKGKSTDSGWERKGTLNMPPPALLAALQKLKARHRRTRSKVPSFLADMLARYPDMNPYYAFQGFENDILFQTHHEDTSMTATVGGHETGRPTIRPVRQTSDPKIHYGVIASGNQVIKNHEIRDLLRKDCGALCVEMEAAGLMNHFPCLVIRGICDYADSYKNDQWHEYAAATAAAFAKELLLYVSPEETARTKPVEDLIKTISKHNEDFREHYQRVELRYQDKTDEKCHQSFKTSPYEEYKNANEEPESGTLKWITDHDAYQKWQSNPHKDLLWISADPGCGKSVLSRWLVDSQLRGGVSRQEVSICYFFFKDNDTQSKLNTALCAILHQLFAQQPELITHAQPMFQRHGQTIQQEKFELWRILLKAARDKEAKSIICVFDALDECKEEDRKVLIELLSEFYHDKTGISESTTYLKFLATSRPYSDIEADFAQKISFLPSVHLRGEDETEQVKKEIDIVIRARLKRMSIPDPVRIRLGEKLSSMENRTYLWLHLALGSIPAILRRSLSPNEESFDSLPTTVDHAYEQILTRVDESLKERVRQILTIIIGAPRPLAVDEMALALGVAQCTHRPQSMKDIQISGDDLGERIRQWCGLFVFITDGRLYLLHQTAKEFLLYNPVYLQGIPRQWKHSLTQQHIDVCLSRVYIWYLCLGEFDRHGDDIVASIKASGTENPSQHPHARFFRLSACNWAQHWRNAESNGYHEDIPSLMLLYDAKSNRYVNWTTGLHIDADGHRLDETLYRFVPDDNPIRLAAFQGHCIVLKQLLRDGTTHDLEACDSRGWTALMRAASMKHLNAVELLIEHGADVNARAHVKPEQYNSYFPIDALSAASHNGDGKMVQTLIDSGACVSAQDARYTALKAAAAQNQEQILLQLIQSGAITNSSRVAVSAALVLALEAGHPSIVKILIANGADVDSQTDEGGTALAIAAFRGYTDMVDLFLREGANVNALGAKYGSALVAACDNGHIDIAKKLVDGGADLDLAAEGRDPALVHAIDEGHTDIAEFLIRRGANVNQEGPCRGRPLEIAIQQGNVERVRLLLQHGAHVNVVDSSGSRPLESVKRTLCAPYTRVTDPNANRSGLLARLKLISQLLIEHGATEGDDEDCTTITHSISVQRKRKRESDAEVRPTTIPQLHLFHPSDDEDDEGGTSGKTAYWKQYLLENKDSNTDHS